MKKVLKTNLSSLAGALALTATAIPQTPPAPPAAGAPPPIELEVDFAKSVSDIVNEPKDKIVQSRQTLDSTGDPATTPAASPAPVAAGAPPMLEPVAGAPVSSSSTTTTTTTIVPPALEPVAAPSAVSPTTSTTTMTQTTVSEGSALDPVGVTSAGTVTSPQPISPDPSATGMPIPPTSEIATATPVAIDPNARASREFEGEEVGTVLRTLARQAKINMVVSPKVVGTVTMRLENVTAMQAIQTIATANDLFLIEENGVVYVKTAEEKKAEPQDAGNFTFNYAKAKIVAPLLQSQLVSGAQPQVDERTNTIFFKEARSNMARIVEFLGKVDKKTKQVMIETRLVETSANPNQSYGINWAGTVGSATSPKTFKFGGSGLADYTPTPRLNTQGVQQLDTNGNPIVDPILSQYPTTTITNGNAGTNDFLFSAERRSGVGDVLSTLGGQLAILSMPQLSATLSLLNEDSDSELIANPRVVTLDNVEAKIRITTAQPVPQLTFNEQTAQSVFGGFEDKIYGNTLIVKPQINKDDYITLEVKPEISNKSRDEIFIAPGSNGAEVKSPVIETRALESTVLIKSGYTLAIGGLMQDEVTKSSTKVPVIGDIPIVGYLFKSTNNIRRKRNLLMFVTPQIITETGTGLEGQITGLTDAKETYADPRGWRNNAKGALRIIPKDTRPIAAEYPAPPTGNMMPVRAAIPVAATAIPYQTSARPRE